MGTRIAAEPKSAALSQALSHTDEDAKALKKSKRIADSPRERFSVDLLIEGPGEHTISLRAYDNSNNVGTISVTVRR